MKLIIPMLLLVLTIPMPVSAMEFTAPRVPSDAQERMPQDTSSFGDGMTEVFQNAFLSLRPDIKEAFKISLTTIVCTMAISILQVTSGDVKTVAKIAGGACIAGTLLQSSNALIHLGAKTIQDMSEYGKLLFPVLTTALAAQGGITTSAGLYAGTMAVIAILSSLISKVLLPLVYVFMALAAAKSISGEAFLGRMKGMIKAGAGWCLKILLTVFTTYLSVTGVVSGTTDAAALKAAKVTISAFVPVVGSVLSDASDSVLVSAGVAKNAAGIYGILAILAVFLEPFLRIGVHYLILKMTALVCELFGPKSLTSLVDDFSSAMGLILAMTGSTCMLLLISTVCFMKGVS